jgi:hypothetical protein
MENGLKEGRADGSVGVGLIDLLFALVLSQVFFATNGTYRDITAAGWGLLILATVLIVLSWVGYHNNRRNSVAWELEFFNQPFFEYAVDILILTAYWAVIITNNGVPTIVHTDSGVAKVFYDDPASLAPAAILIAVVFALYLLWDLLAVSIVKDPDYVKEMDDSLLVDGKYSPVTEEAACWVTFWFFLLFLGGGLLALLFPPRGDVSILVISLSYCVALALYRWVQARHITRAS